MAGNLLAQTSDKELADHYFNSGEFEKATMYLERLYDKSKDDSYFEKLFTSYQKTEAHKEAEKLVKSHFSRLRNSTRMNLYLARVYENSDEKKLKKTLEDLCTATYNRSTELTEVADFLINAKYYEEGLKALENNKARLSSYNYFLYRARIYGGMGEMQAMIDQYVKIVLDNGAYLRHVQSSLDRYLNFTENPEESELLRISLLKAQQSSNYNPSVSNLLYWYYIQIKDFSMAFDQLKALSKRQGPQLERLQSLAAVVSNNENYELAFEIYDFLLGLEGLDALRKEIAMAKRVSFAFAALKSKSDIVSENSVDEYFREFNSNYELNESNTFLYLDLIDYQFKLKQNKDSALTLCNKVINHPGLYDKSKAFAKLKKADILVSDGKIWEASLLNSQVDLDFKNDELGSLAKLKNAKIAFYAGDFEWSQAQLDIIKASTSELISNDAIDLSLVITDNLNLDTSGEALGLYAQADLALLQNKTTEALAFLDSISAKFPTHSLNDEILWKKYELAMADKNFDLAKSHLELLLEKYYFDIYADDANFYLGQLLEQEYKDYDAAKQYYEKVITEFPESIFATQARKRLRILERGIIKFEG